MLDVALLIITLTTAGEQRLSITESSSVQACQRTRATIVGVLKQRDVKVVEARCAKNALALTPYVHGAVNADYKHHYRVTLLPAEDYQLTYLKPTEACVPKVHADKAVLCAVASQQPID